jgi:hypothetical protein
MIEGALIIPAILQDIGVDDTCTAHRKSKYLISIRVRMNPSILIHPIDKPTVGRELDDI